MTIENILFDVADALRYPVLILAMLAIVVVLLEAGALLMELRKRRGRGLPRLERALDVSRQALATGDPATALTTIRALGYNRPMTDALSAIVEQRGKPDAADRIAKRMAEYDYRSMRRLERTRILVRAGPALGLMGTLIPLSPALAALSRGDVQRLTDDLRVAFSVTVAGLLVGMIAFAVSLVRDRLYAQDYSDVEYVLAGLSGSPISPKAPATGEAKAAATEVAQSGATATAVLPATAAPVVHPDVPPAAPGQPPPPAVPAAAPPPPSPPPPPPHAPATPPAPTVPPAASPPPPGTAAPPAQPAPGTPAAMPPRPPEGA
jgi:biopolymer transport protein ExbB/TolQ